MVNTLVIKPFYPQTQDNYRQNAHQELVFFTKSIKIDYVPTLIKIIQPIKSLGGIWGSFKSMSINALKTSERGLKDSKHIIIKIKSIWKNWRKYVWRQGY